MAFNCDGPMVISKAPKLVRTLYVDMLVETSFERFHRNQNTLKWFVVHENWHNLPKPSQTSSFFKKHNILPIDISFQSFICFHGLS